MSIFRRLEAPPTAAEQMAALFAARAAAAADADPAVRPAGEDELFRAMGFFQDHPHVPDRNAQGLPTPVVLIRTEPEP